MQSGLAASFVTPSPKKNDWHGNQFVEYKRFINKRKPSSTTVVKGVLNNGEHTLIPVTAKMIHSAVWDSERFVLKDGQPLHMVKLVGAVRNFCVNIGPEGRPNNLQSAWRLVELFFWSDLSWSQADLCADSYLISTCFSLLSTMPLCTHYISYVGILRIIHNALFRISIILDNMAIRPYRFSSYLWLFVFFDFYITYTYCLILCFGISSHCVF